MTTETETPDGSKWTTITVTKEFRDRLRSMKRGQESYTELLERKLKQCDDDEHE